MKTSASPSSLVGGAILSVGPLGMPFKTIDPFLFAVYHDDNYPAGEESMGPPQALLRGRMLGQDFGSRTGWNMYHGRSVPGFPKHPHRGFETVTLVRHGVVDHCDSLGSKGRFGEGGDVQWMTAGKGISHSEMFPLLKRDGPNRLELFQIWLNLERTNKMRDPHFKMLWHEDIPTAVINSDGSDATTTLAVIAGQGFLGVEADSKVPEPPPASYASKGEASDVAIVTLTMEPGANYTLPAARGGDSTRRKLFYFKGPKLSVDGKMFEDHSGIELRGGVAVGLEAAGDGPVELLLLQGKPIGEPVVQHGPFVMTSREEIIQAFTDYQTDEFGDWNHGSDAPVHPRDAERFAVHADGKREERKWASPVS
mmetsp:Transcript_24591/g.63489  ORF Transcript_24591/g.63489 Transcript_24591/m.63489 type:complete len:367 (+) Transcript_24591:69-1169(+)